MGRYISLAAAAAILIGFIWFLTGNPTQAPAPRVIGVLQFTPNNLTTLEGFKAGMAELGYVEGKTIRYIFDGPAKKIEELGPMVKKLLDRNPDLLFTSPTPATIAAKRATGTNKVPIVFAPVNDPIAAGIVSDIKNPGDNITGIRLASSDGRRLQWINEIAPEASRVWLPYNAKDKSALTSLANAEKAAAGIGMEILPLPVESHADIDKALTEVPEGIQGIFLPRDGMVMSRVKDFVALSMEKKLILSTPRLKQVELGAFTGYGFIGFELGKQAARLADKILKGADPGRLPVETAEDYLFLNLKTAEAIGRNVPDHILRQARDIVTSE